jgi:hypothetical protein
MKLGEEMKKRINYTLLLWTSFLILIIQDYRNLKYFLNLIRELKKIIKNQSGYKEDGDFVLIHKSRMKEL